jgi:Leucine-rich repeat (LRR) protein
MCTCPSNSEEIEINGPGIVASTTQGLIEAGERGIEAINNIFKTLSGQKVTRKKEPEVTIPACPVTFPNVTRLKINNQKLTTVKNLNTMQSLMNIDLSNNKISTIDARNIPKNVRKLNLDHNPAIKKIENIDRLEILQDLSVKGGETRFYLDGIEKLKYLTSIDLRYRLPVPSMIFKDGKQVPLNKKLSGPEITLLRAAMRKIPPAVPVPPVKTFPVPEITAQPAPVVKEEDVPSYYPAITPEKEPEPVTEVVIQREELETEMISAGDVCFDKFDKKHGLFLNDLGLPGIPSCLGEPRYTMIDRLSMENNNITSIMPLINYLNSGLEYLDASGNKIREISGIGRFSKLKGLDLSNNKIKEMSGIYKLEKLETLNLNNDSNNPDGNKITLIGSVRYPLAIGNLKNLKELLLRNNDIKGMEGIDGISKLEKLEILDLTGNNSLPRFECNGKIYTEHGMLYRKGDIKNMRKCLKKGNYNLL